MRVPQRAPVDRMRVGRAISAATVAWVARMVERLFVVVRRTRSGAPTRGRSATTIAPSWRKPTPRSPRPSARCSAPSRRIGPRTDCSTSSTSPRRSRSTRARTTAGASTCRCPPPALAPTFAAKRPSGSRPPQRRRPGRRRPPPRRGRVCHPWHTRALRRDTDRRHRPRHLPRLRGRRRRRSARRRAPWHPGNRLFLHPGNNLFRAREQGDPHLGNNLFQARRGGRPPLWRRPVGRSPHPPRRRP